MNQPSALIILVISPKGGNSRLVHTDTALDDSSAHESLCIWLLPQPDNRHCIKTHNFRTNSPLWMGLDRLAPLAATIAALAVATTMQL